MKQVLVFWIFLSIQALAQDETLNHLGNPADKDQCGRIRALAGSDFGKSECPIPIKPKGCTKTMVNNKETILLEVSKEENDLGYLEKLCIREEAGCKIIATSSLLFEANSPPKDTTCNRKKIERLAQKVNDHNEQSYKTYPECFKTPPTPVDPNSLLTKAARVLEDLKNSTKDTFSFDKTDRSLNSDCNIYSLAISAAGDCLTHSWYQIDPCTFTRKPQVPMKTSPDHDPGDFLDAAP